MQRDNNNYKSLYTFKYCLYIYRNKYIKKESTRNSLKRIL